MSMYVNLALFLDIFKSIDDKSNSAFANKRQKKYVNKFLQ